MPPEPPTPTVPMEGEETLRYSERRFRKLVQRSSDITVVVDEQMRIQWVSPAVRPVLGYAQADLQGMIASELLHPNDVEPVLGHMASILEGATYIESVTARLMHHNGSYRYVGIVASDLTADPDVGGLLLNVRDITSRMTAQRDSDRLARILGATSDIVVIWEDGAVVYLNQAAHDFVDLPQDSDFIGGNVFDRVPTWVARQWTDEIRPAVVENGLWSGELAARNPSGRVVPLSVVILHRTDPEGVRTFSIIARDMSERAEFESRLEHQATHDPLTGLPNRTLLLDRLEVALGRAERSHLPIAVLFIDLDHFKVVNDSLGHGYGDRLLMIVADRLAKVLRPGDTVARFGGDEFVILCEDLADTAEAETIADRVAATIAMPVNVDSTEVFVSASIGIAMARGGRDEAEELLRDADAAMYEAKERGRSRSEVFDSRMRTRAVDRLELEGALRRAIERHELRVAFQPQVSLSTGRTVGFEALLRWENPDRGLLLPDDFLAIAEETRLILPIGNWVVRQACRALAKAQAQALERQATDEVTPRERLVVAVNLSARQLANAHLPAEFAEIFNATGVDPRDVHVEITESVLMEDVEGSQRELARLKSLGVLIGVDDFGTGYSSLAYLRRFPVDLLKVDRSFVDGLGSDPGDSAIVAAIVNLAHTLGMEAIAEGVETAEQLAELRRLGCDKAQGYLLAHPMSEADLLEHLAAHT